MPTLPNSQSPIPTLPNSQGRIASEAHAQRVSQTVTRARRTFDPRLARVTAHLWPGAPLTAAQ